MLNSCRCAPAGRDLVCSTSTGYLLIIRDYANILAIPDEDELVIRWAESTIAIGLGATITGVSIHDTRIAVSTQRDLVFFDTATLPRMPLDGDTVPPIRVRSVLPVDSRMVERSRGPQLYRTALYTMYYAYDPKRRLPAVKPCLRKLDFSGAGSGAE
jgi:hypothetical protein